MDKLDFPSKEALKAVLIDFDGTLANSMELLYKGYLEFLSGFGYEGSRDEFETLTGPSVLEIVGKLKLKYHLDLPVEELCSDYILMIREKYVSETPIFPGAIEFLNYAKEQGYLLAIVSSSQRSEIMDILNHHAIAHFFDTIITSEDVEQTKPHPEIYLKALETLSVKAEEAVALEDSLNGAKSSQGAGIATLLIHALHFTNAPQCASWAEVMQFFTSGNLSFLLKDVPKSISLHSYFRKTLPVLIQEKVDEIWNQEVDRKALYNGKFLNVNGFEKGGLHASLIDYKYYFAQQQDPALASYFNIKPLTITAITLWQDEILIGKRSSKVTQYPGCYELVLSGGVETVHLKDQVLAELREEAGYLEEDLETIQIKYFVHDVQDELYEVCFELLLKEKRMLPRGQEHQELFWVKLSELPKWMDFQEVVPIARFLVNLYGEEK